MANKDIRYLNKDYTDLKATLIEYAKAYFPESYNDFTTASPGSMFIEMAAYVGDVLSFYLDNQIQETFLQYAKQPANLYAMAYTLGYRPKATSAATVDLDVYQLLPSKVVGGEYIPDYDYALIIEEGMEVSSGGSGQKFYLPDAVNFSISGSTTPTEISIYQTDINGNPEYFLLKKTAPAISGTPVTTIVSFGQAEKFKKITLSDSNIIEIVDAVDDDGNKWYEVPYLAQDTVLEPVANLRGITPSFTINQQVPYFLQSKKVPRRFVTRVQPDNTLVIEFGPGINSVADEAIVPNPNKAGIGLLDGLSKLNTAYDPTNFTTTYTYGLAPANTRITFTYLTGGGAAANVPANTINGIDKVVTSFFTNSPTDPGLGNIVRNSVTVNNAFPAGGGGGGDTVDQIKLNTLLQYPTQMRAVTNQDYLAFAYSMPGKYGKVSKAYITRDAITFSNITTNTPGVQDPLASSLYVLGFDTQERLALPTLELKENLKTYLSHYRMLTDTVTIRDAYIVNIGVTFEVTLRPDYSGREVLLKCITALKNYFNVDLWEINQPIILPDVYTLLDRIEGVQTVKKVTIVNKYGEVDGYSQYAYDISAATVDNIIYPSLDPCIFEVKYPDTDIKGKVVTF
jgi:hypothetical protein